MRLPWRRKPRPDPDLAVRAAQAAYDCANFLAAEHERTTDSINARIKDNHISDSIGAWFSEPTPPHHHRRRMPWKAS